MKKERTNKNIPHYLYVVVENSSLELPVYVTPNSKEFCDYIGISPHTLISTLSRLKNKEQLQRAFKLGENYRWTVVNIDYDREFFRKTITQKIREHNLTRKSIAELVGVTLSTFTSWVYGYAFVPFDSQTELNNLFNYNLFVPAN